jgi:uncharacterized membrane protein YkoI
MSRLKFMLCLSAVAAILATGITGARAGEEKDDEKVASVSDLPAAARATVEKLTAGGTIKSILKEDENGKIVFDVEATVKGKDVEYSVDADGKIITSEESIEYSSMPAAVRAAAEKYFGSATGLKASKELENGQTFFEVESQKDGKKATVKYDATGKQVEEEKD